MNCLFNLISVIDHCESMPCLNGATCLSVVNKFICSCIPGYTGLLCQTGNL